MQEETWKQKLIWTGIGIAVFTGTIIYTLRIRPDKKATQPTEEDGVVDKAVKILQEQGHYLPERRTVVLDYNSIEAEPNSDPNRGSWGYLDQNNSLVLYCWDGRYAERGPDVIAQPGWGFLNLVTDPNLDNVAKSSLEDALIDLKGGNTMVREGRPEPTLVAVTDPNCEGLQRVNLGNYLKLREQERNLNH